jgi:hypothetical protein
MDDEREPIPGAEKGWGVVMAILGFPIGLLALLGLLLNQDWGRWLGLLAAVLVTGAGIFATLWLGFVIIATEPWNYPFGPWFIVFTAIYAVIGWLAAKSFLKGLRAT